MRCEKFRRGTRTGNEQKGRNLNCIICERGGNSVLKRAFGVFSHTQRQPKRAKSEKVIFLWNIFQHESENIYSVLAFINILLKQARQKFKHRYRTSRGEEKHQQPTA